MEKQINQVKEFNDLFNIYYKNSPELSDTWVKRVSFLQEELDELKEAHEQKDLKGVADAYCDLLYFLVGGVLDNGLQNLFSTLFDVVHDSNMSKACNSIEEANATIDNYSLQGIKTHFVERADKFLIFRDDTMKVQKNINYKTVDFSDYLE